MGGRSMAVGAGSGAVVLGRKKREIVQTLLVVGDVAALFWVEHLNIS